MSDNRLPNKALATLKTPVSKLSAVWMSTTQQIGSYLIVTMENIRRNCIIVEVGNTEWKSIEPCSLFICDFFAVPIMFYSSPCVIQDNTLIYIVRWITFTAKGEKSQQMSFKKTVANSSTIYSVYTATSIAKVNTGVNIGSRADFPLFSGPANIGYTIKQ